MRQGCVFMRPTVFSKEDTARYYIENRGGGFKRKALASENETQREKVSPPLTCACFSSPPWSHSTCSPYTLRQDSLSKPYLVVHW